MAILKDKSLLFLKVIHQIVVCREIKCCWYSPYGVRAAVRVRGVPVAVNVPLVGVGEVGVELEGGAGGLAAAAGRLNCRWVVVNLICLERLCRGSRGLALVVRIQRGYKLITQFQNTSLYKFSLHVISPTKKQLFFFQMIKCFENVFNEMLIPLFFAKFSESNQSPTKPNLINLVYKKIEIYLIFGAKLTTFFATMIHGFPQNNYVKFANFS